MNRPHLEIADIIRAQGEPFVARNRSWIHWAHQKVLRAIVHCRTAALGGHLHHGSACGYRAIAFHSCRNRHCPKCQVAARRRWLTAREKELLPVRYFHVVFTLPHQLSPLLLQNKKLLYDLLFRASAETLLELALDPKHLGAQIASNLNAVEYPDELVQLAFSVIDDAGREEIVTGQCPTAAALYQLVQEAGWLGRTATARPIRMQTRAS